MAELNLEEKLDKIKELIKENRSDEAVEKTESLLKQIFSFVFREAIEELGQEEKGKVQAYQNKLDKSVEDYSIFEFLQLFTRGNILEAYQERKNIKLHFLNEKICKQLLEEHSKEEENNKSIFNEDPTIAYSMLNKIARDFDLLPMNPITRKFYNLVEDLNQENLQEFTNTFSFDEKWEKIGLDTRLPRNTGLYIGICPYCDKGVRMIYNKFYTGHKYFALECPHCSQKIGCHNKFAGLTSELTLDKYDTSKSESTSEEGRKIEEKNTILKKLKELDRSEKTLRKK
jgi:hypothetical protein